LSYKIKYKIWRSNAKDIIVLFVYIITITYDSQKTFPKTRVFLPINFISITWSIWPSYKVHKTTIRIYADWYWYNSSLSEFEICSILSRDSQSCKFTSMIYHFYKCQCARFKKNSTQHSIAILLKYLPCISFVANINIAWCKNLYKVTYQFIDGLSHFRTLFSRRKICTILAIEILDHVVSERCSTSA